MMKFICIAIFLITVPKIGSSQFIFNEIMDAGNLPEIENGAIDTADVDMDGDLDVFILGKPDGQPIAKLFLNDGQGVFSESQAFTGVDLGQCDFADVDGDDDMDLAYNGQTSGGTGYSALFINDGSGTFSISTSTLTPLKYSSLAFGNVNGDGDIDLLMSGTNNGGTDQTILYENDGLGNFSVVVATPFLGLQAPDINFLDVDGDLDQDILLNGYVSGTIATTKMYINDGVGNYSEQASGIANIAWGEIGYSDVDGDGDYDILSTGYINATDNSTDLYLNNGSGAFTLDVTNTFVNLGNSTVSFADLDQDGDEDLILTGKELTSVERMLLYENDGSGNFSEVSVPAFIGITRRFSTAVFDLENDGDLDICTIGAPANSGGFNEVHLYQQFTCPDDITKSLSVTEPTLTSEHDHDDASYIWLDCDNSYQPFNFETDISFTPPSNGNYAVRISQYGCIDTSDCYAITTVGNPENENPSLFLYPNPSQGQFQIQTANQLIHYLQIRDIQGQLIADFKEINDFYFTVDLNLSGGIYIIEVKLKELTVKERLIIE